MNNWYTVAIAFLGGTAIGLLGFLFIQPAQSGNPDHNAAKQEDTQTSSVNKVESGSVETQNSATENKTESDESSPSVKEKWEGETAKTSAIPHLTFYYKPG